MKPSVEQVPQNIILSYFETNPPLSNSKKAKFLQNLYKRKVIFVNKLGFDYLLSEFIGNNK